MKDIRIVLTIARPITPEQAQAYALKEYKTLGKVIASAKIPTN